ncbi:hypothetical protein EIM44_04895 [Bibersteinia trehalosi]|uniref:Uncharacterized protein n=1 Tax=Bibersteinia trehalosi TaxID=47735 RepID=A0A3R8SRR7_BIBTR|nr:hypothetical protein [Bibersteinia trehalosi]RRN04778.1 hypothetical protein EIM44_04895 [Bibersteinia trehalosi]
MSSYLSVSEFDLTIKQSENGKCYQLKQGEKIQATGSLNFCLDIFFERLKEQKKHALQLVAKTPKTIKVTFTAR